jgi:two-component system chemotaxis response regulator CheY
MAKHAVQRFASAGALADALIRAGSSWFAQDDDPPEMRRSMLPPSPAPAAKARVLVVDDDDVFRSLATRAIQLAFEPTGVTVMQARSGAEAIALAKRAVPQLVILDYNMPRLDGIATLTRLRELPGGEEAHVVVASASCSDDHRWRFAALGVADFIEKPVGIRELERRVSALRARNGWGAQAVVESTVRGQGGVPRGERAAG